MSISAATRLIAIFGDPVGHSLSPLMQNAALDAADFDARYLAFRVAPSELPRAVDAVRTLDMLGANLTVPHKEAVLPLLDHLDEQARLMGAINTIVNRDGRLHGYNTDGAGLLRALREELDVEPRGVRVVVLGAGGACRGALVALATAGAARLLVVNRNSARAAEVVNSLADSFPGTEFAYLGLDDQQSLATALTASDVLINATSLGLHGEEIALPWPRLSPRIAVYDMVYGRDGTPLIRAARQHGLRCADGLSMLVAQGEEAFCLWTGKSAPKGVMRASLLAHLGKIPA